MSLLGAFTGMLGDSWSSAQDTGTAILIQVWGFEEATLVPPLPSVRQ